MLLHEVVEFAARWTPDDDTLVFADRRWTFGELWAAIEATGVWLAERVEPGERVAIVADNRPEVVIALYAIPMVGAIAMLANTRLVPAEIAALLDDVRPTVVLGSTEQLARIATHLDASPSVRHVADLDELLPLRRPTVPPSWPIGPDDVAWIIHTSGTTGRPKGALLTHRSLGTGVLATALARPVAPDDTYLFPFPLFHVAAYGVVHMHFRGRPVVLVPKFDAVEVMAAIERHRVTTISLAPTMIAMLLDHPDRERYDLSSLRHIFYGASAIPLDVLRRGLAEFGCGFGQGYGMTELSGNLAFLDAAAHERAATTDPHLLAAAGKVGTLASLRLAPDGEILVRGDQVIPGYWERPDVDADAFADGWFHTGDVGRLDDEGFLYIVDRKKDIIVSGGENVASLEVEDVLGAHPAIASVAVVGVPDERWGERVVAVAVPRAGAALDEAEVLAWCEGRLAGFKRPRRLFVVDELATNASGKVLKREIHELTATLDAAGA